MIVGVRMLLRFILTIAAIQTTVPVSTENFEEIYKSGIAAYNKKQWATCQELIKDGLKYYNSYITSAIDCHLHCAKSDDLTNIGNLHTMDDVSLAYNIGNIKTFPCFRTCKQSYEIDYSVSYIALMDFDDYIPYNFLQYCAYKTGSYKDAAAALYTYYIRHMACENTISNMELYRSLPGVKSEHFVDLEEKAYQRHYELAMQAYNNEEWEIVDKEIAITALLYLREERRCRTLCSLRQHNNTINQTELSRQIEVIKCQYNCEGKLGKIAAETVPFYYANLFHYRQYAYYKLKRLRAAITDIATFLLFQPHDDVMLANKVYYTHLGYTEEDFTPLEEAVQYHTTRRKLQKTWDFIRESYPHLFASEVEPLPKPDPTLVDRESEELSRFRRMGINVIVDEEGEIVADGFLRIEQCEVISDLIKLSSQQTSDGIHHATMPDILKFISAQSMEMVSLRVLLTSTNLIRIYLQAHMRSSTLHIRAMNLTCSQSLGNRSRPDCLIQVDGQCMKDFPQNKTDRYIAIMHLSYLATGGETFISSRDVNSKGRKLKPACGLLTVFPSSSPHGVYPHDKSERCTIMYGLTTDAHAADRTILAAFKSIENPAEIRGRDKISPDKRREIITQLEENGVQITVENSEKKEVRFFADGLMDGDMCKRLINIAQFTEVADGYKHLKHVDRGVVFTNKEIFAGLKVDKMEEVWSSPSSASSVSG